MTDEEWGQSVDLTAMLKAVAAASRLGYRKRGLFACACVRRMSHSLIDERSRNAIKVTEQFLDGAVDGGAKIRAQREAWAVVPEVFRRGRWPPPITALGPHELAATSAAGLLLGTWVGNAEAAADAVLELVAQTTERGPARRSAVDAERAALCQVLRDLVGPHPFGPPPALDPAWLRFQNGLVGRLAIGIYERRRYRDLPLLADALVDAGAGDGELLDHLRGSWTAHVRGCWALDLLTPTMPHNSLR